MAVDLHTHSVASDGSDRPGHVVRLAAEIGLGALALTDHDTLDGIPEARVAAERAGIRLVPGVELSLDWGSGGMHLVVLFLEPVPGPLQDRLAGLQEARARRNERMVGRLQALGYSITLEQVNAEAGEGVAGRPHMAAVLADTGQVPDIAAAFDDLLGNGRPAYVGRERLAPGEALDLARRSGAVSVLAHPHTLGLDRSAQFAEVFEELAAAGLDGVECHYPEYPAEHRAALEDMAGRFGLLPSGGSDYHGRYKPGLRLGVGRDDLWVPDRVLAALESRRAAA